MRKFETIWQVIQEVAIVQEGGCSFDDESLLNQLIQMKREEFPDCTVKVYHEFWTTTHCSIMYENHIKSWKNENDDDDDDEEILPLKPQGDC
jgi:hypothetical protein